MNELISETIGCDLGDKTSSLFILSPDASEVRPKPIPTTKDGMRDFFKGRPKAHVILENGTHSRWVSSLVKELGHQVTVANPYRVKLISANVRKGDDVDAELLARLGHTGLKLLAPINHRGDQAQAHLAILKARDSLVACQTKLVNQVRGLVKSFGSRLPKCTAESFHQRMRGEIPENLEPAVIPLLDTLEAIRNQIRKQEKQLERVAKQYPEVKSVSQPVGVGLITALAFVLTLERKERFAKSRDVGPYLGLVPRRDQSGTSDKQLGITKAGDGLVRRLLVNSANYIMGPFGMDSDLRRKGLMLAERGGKNARKRAKIALARKLGVLMHRLWVTGEKYEPLRNAKTTAQ